MDVREKLVEHLRWWSNECDRTNFGCQVSELLVAAANYIAHGVTEQEWISVEDRLPENSEHLGALCPRYMVATKYGVTEGWYNPDRKSWYVLFWYLNDLVIDLEKGSIPRLTKVPYDDDFLTHWMPMPEPPKEG